MISLLRPFCLPAARKLKFTKLTYDLCTTHSRTKLRNQAWTDNANKIFLIPKRHAQLHPSTKSLQNPFASAGAQPKAPRTEAWRVARKGGQGELSGNATLLSKESCPRFCIHSQDPPPRWYERTKASGILFTMRPCRKHRARCAGMEGPDAGGA